MRTRADLRAGGGTWLAVTLSLGGAPRSLALRGWAPAALIGLGSALAAWYLGATLYFVFHDQLLAGLMARQTAAQYAYEDRIASLSVQLDQQTSRALVDRRTLETSVRDLQERSARLAARAALVEQLVAHQPATTLVGSASGSPGERSRVPTDPSRNPLLTGRVARPEGVSAFAASPAARPAIGLSFEAAPLRLGEGAAPGDAAPQASGAAPDKRASLEPGALDSTVAADLSRAEQDQNRALAALRDPTLRYLARLKAALAEVGMASDVAPGKDVGGPFVPLPEPAMSFEGGAALLQDALRQAEQLSALADRVPLRRPVAGALEVTSSFGPRLDPFLGRPAMHTGVDLRDAYGTDVRATAAGTVTVAASEGGYGTMVEVNHGGGLVTRYAHLARALVAPGQHVEAGGIVGLVGSSGRATGPHLHYETRVNGEPVDPTRFLKAGARLFAAS